MASLEATRPTSSPGAGGAITPSPGTTPSAAPIATSTRSLSPPPPRPISPLIARPQRHQNHVLPPVPDHEPGDVPSPIAGSTILDRRQQTQQQNQPRPIRKLRLPPSRTNAAGLGGGVAGNNPNIPGLSSVRSNQQQHSQNLNTPTPASLSINRQRASNNDDDEEEVEEVLEELEDEPESEHLSANLEHTAQSDVVAACLSVQNATAAALRSCINSMLSLSMPEGNIDSSSPVATVQILNQILQSTFSFSSSSNSPAPSFSTLSRQLNQVAAQQPLLASSEDLTLSHALINLLAALQAARDAPSPPPTKISPDLRNRAGEDRQAESPVSTEFSPMSPSPTGEQGTSKAARRLSNNTVASSPAASDELRDPFAESRHQDEFIILLKRLNTLATWVPDSRTPPSGSELSQAGSSTTSLGRYPVSAQSKTDPWTQLANAIAQARELAIVKKRTAPSSGSGPRSHSFSDSPMSPTLLSHGLSTGMSKGQPRSRSTSRRGSVSSINSPIHNPDASSSHLPVHPGASHDALLSSSSSGRQSTQSLRSSNFSTAGTLAEAPTWLSAGNSMGVRPPTERRSSLSSTTDVNSTVGPHKNSTDSLVDPFLVRSGKAGDLRKDELAARSRPGSYHSAADEKVVPGRHSEDSLVSGYGASEVDYDVLKERQRRKKTLASDLDAIEHNLGRLFSAAPPLNDQRAAPPRVRPKSAASDSLTIQNGSIGFKGPSLGRPPVKEKMPDKIDFNSPEAIQGRSQTLRDVIDKLGRPRMEDQRMAPPVLRTPMFFDDDPVIPPPALSKYAKYGSVGKNAAKDGIGSVPKIGTSYDERPGLAGSHARSLSQKLVDVVSFKRGRGPPSPLQLGPGGEAGSSKSLSSQRRTGSMTSQEAALASSLTRHADEAEGEDDDEMDFLEFMQRASGRSMDEQRGPSKTRAPAIPKKLAKMGIDQTQPKSWVSADEPDTDLFEQLIQSSTRSRFSNQEAELRPQSSTSAKMIIPPVSYGSMGSSAFSGMPGSAPLNGPSTTLPNSRALNSATFQKHLPPSLPSEMYRSTHRITHSVPMAAYNPHARDDHAPPEMSMRYAKAPAFTTAASVGGRWQQEGHQSISSHHHVPVEHVAFKQSGAMSAEPARKSMDDYHEDDALEEEGYLASSAQDFRARLSDLPSPSGSLSPVAGTAQRGASSGWAPSGTHNLG